MGRMKIGSQAGTPRSVKQVVKHETIVQQISSLDPELVARIEALELANLEPEAAPVETLVEKHHTLETVKEVSVITKDKRSRKHSSLVSEKLRRQQHHISILIEQHEAQDLEIETLKELVFKLRSEVDSVEKRETALEAQIPEEKQEVTQPKLGLLHLGVGVSILLSIVTLILK